jgi:hypothetical protein
MTDREVGAEFAAGRLGCPALASKCRAERFLCLDLYSVKIMYTSWNSRPSAGIYLFSSATIG